MEYPYPGILHCPQADLGVGFSLYRPGEQKRSQGAEGNAAFDTRGVSVRCISVCRTQGDIKEVSHDIYR